MKNRFYCLLLLFSMVSAGCEKEEEIFVDTDLLPYFERFELEAAARGITFNFENDRIEGYLENIEETDVSGKCQFNSVYPDKVSIDANFWRLASDLEKEFVVFHELGHCFLEREHTEEATNGNVCKSIMHSGTGTCRNAYSNITRANYLDELFAVE